MNLQTVTLEPIRSQKVAIIGYGNQGRVQALNLRDSGVKVNLGLRPGKSKDRALSEGWFVMEPAEAVACSQVVMCLLPDEKIAEFVSLHDSKDKLFGVSHGYAFSFADLKPASHHFLVGPRAAGRVLRERFLSGGGVVGVYALGPGSSKQTESVVASYAKAIGLRGRLVQTTFREEAVCDLFGEQAVLCGGLMELMQAAFETLVEKGVSKEMAFYECCYEVKTIMELLLERGPGAFMGSVSSAAFYGGSTRGKRIVNEDTRKELSKIYDEIASGKFARELRGASLSEKRSEWDSTRKQFQSVYEGLKDNLV